MHIRSRALLALAQIDLPRPMPRATEFIEGIAAGAIRAGIAGPHVLLSYTRRGVFDSHWHSVATHARGLIIDTRSPEDPIAARPFFRFLDLELDDPLPREDPPHEVTRKLDGALAISYMASGRVRWAGRTSFRSLPARLATETWEVRTDRVLADNLTLLCEVRDPSLRTLVPVRSRTLHVIGAIDRHTGRDINYDELTEIARLARLPIVERIEWPGSLERLWARIFDDNLRQEGFVLRWHDGLRARVVHPDYGPVYDMTCEPTPWMVSEIWSEHDDPGRLFERLPPPVAARVMPLVNELDELCAAVRQAGLGNKREAMLVFRARHTQQHPRSRFLPLDV